MYRGPPKVRTLRLDSQLETKKPNEILSGLPSLVPQSTASVPTQIITLASTGPSGKTGSGLRLVTIHPPRPALCLSAVS